MHLVLCLVFLLFSGAASAQSGGPLDGFDAYIRDGIALWEPPGLAIAVVKDGEVVFMKGYGVRELGKSEPADEHTLFAIGSTTKAMTAALVGMLVDEDELGWDDPVQEHLPWFRVQDPYVSRELTVRDLLTHSGGLPNADFLWYGQAAMPRDVLERMRFVEQETSTRSAFTYQNIMYAAAGALVAEVSGRRFRDLRAGPGGRGRRARAGGRTIHTAPTRIMGLHFLS